LGIPDAPSKGEFQLVIRGTPVFDSSPFGLVVSYPRLARFLGARMAERQVAKQISRQLREPFHAALETYWQLARVWANSVIGQLKQKFETYAENYRVHAELAFADKELTKMELDAIEEDIVRLKQPDRERDLFEAASTGGQAVQGTPK
jgi:alkylated DNA nucleotide flippase Atl1